MREESHLDDMRAAIRGDFERLAERRGGQELMSAAPEIGEPAETPETGEPPEATETPEAAHGHREPVPAPPPTPPAAEPEPTPAPKSAFEPPAGLGDLERPTAEPEREPEDVLHRSWLARLFGR